MKKIFKKLIPILLVVAVSVGVYFQLPKSNLSLNKPSKNVAAYKNLNPKLINFFKNIQKEPQNIDQLLLALQPLSLDELNKAYNFAVDSHLYDIATSFYKLGAKDCYQRGRDILLLAINSGQLDLAKDLLNQNYKINNDHINSIRCLLNLNSNNWAFLYNKCFLCEEGFQDYQSSSRDFSKDLLAKYSEQNPVDLSGFDQLPQHQKSYRAIFGEKAIDAFRKEVNYTLDHNYQIIKAAYGSQRTPVIVNSEGKRVAVIKTKNELLAQKLDHEHFAHVPPCIIATVPDYGEVVLQKWVSDSKMAFENQDPKAWSPEQLHHIRALDIRLGNSDRNKGNILVATRENQQYVVPIDHDLLMYYMPNDNNWQANYLNAYFSPLTKEYIEKIDIEKDAKIMADLDYSLDDIKTMKIRTTLLKMAIDKNLTLKELDMLFRFYYYEILEECSAIVSSSSQKEIKETLHIKMEDVRSVVQNPIEVWQLIGNNFEFYM